MGITGRFEADFQSFYQAVDRANAKLTDFQSGAGKVETSLNRMVDNFSGRRLIQEVTLSVEAVNRLDGGIKNLTDNELQSLAAKAVEAVAKMKAMGVVVPPEIQKVAGELKHASEESGFLGKSFEDIGSKVIAAFAIERVVEFVLEVGKAQQQLQRLGKETQIDVEELQTLTAATAGYGLTNEELGRSLFNLSQRIAGGDASVARGLHQIGLSLDDVRNKHGKELFLEVENGLAKLQGQLRDTAAADIWGAKLGASLGGFAKEANEAVDKADKLNSKLSRESVAAMAEYADAVERAERNLGTLRDSMIGPLAQGINVINDANQKGIGFWRSIGLATKDALFYIPGLTSGGHALADALDQVNRANVEGAASTKGATEQHKQAEVAITAETQAVRFLMALRRDAAKELTPLQKLALADLREMGALTSDNAAAVGVGVDQFKQYVEQVRQAEATTKLLTSTTAEQTEQVRKLRAEVEATHVKQTGTQTEIELAELQKREDEEIASIERRAAAAKASLEQQHVTSKEAYDKIAADAAAATASVKGSFDQLREGVGVDFDEIRKHSQAALQDAADRALKTLVEAQATVGISRAEIDKLTDNYRKAAFAATAMGQQSVDSSTKSTAAIEDTNAALIKQQDAQRKLQELERSKGGSIEITAANFDQYTAPQGLSKSAILALLKQGFSMQNAVEILRAQLRGAAVDLSKWPEDLRGPRVPGFEGGVQNWPGGKALIGEHGPEVLDLPAGSSVIPMRNARGFGGGLQVYAPTYVSGVFDPFARHALSGAVTDNIMRRVLASRVA